jgi:arylsulfatase A-like enzyme
MKKPNILLIMGDQMRHDALACNGNEHIKTPGFDRLAARGVNYSNSYTPNPVCVAARATLTTGCYPQKCIGNKGNDGAIGPEFPTLGDELHKRGYATYAMGKLHYCPYMPPGTPQNTQGIKTVEFHESGRMLYETGLIDYQRGVEDFLDYLEDVGWGGYSRGDGMGNNDVYPTTSPLPADHFSDAWVASRAIHHMGKHLDDNPEQPFFMWASFPKPHSAFDPPRPYDALYDPRALPKPTGTINDIIERGHLYWYQEYLSRYWDLLSPACKQVIKAHYYGLVTFQDGQVARLLDFLAGRGIDDNTIILYTADHGEMLGDFDIFFKGNMYSASVRVPLMISYPGVIPAGVVSDGLAGLQDILPTLLALTGEPLGVPVDGADLFNNFDRDIYVSNFGDDPAQQYMAANKRFKYMYHQMGAIEELYDQTNDRAELRNLIDDPAHAGTKAELKTSLRAWLAEHDPAMLDGEGFAASPQAYDLTKPPRHNKYGRRWY